MIYWRGYCVEYVVCLFNVWLLLNKDCKWIVFREKFWRVVFWLCWICIWVGFRRKLSCCWSCLLWVILVWVVNRCCWLNVRRLILIRIILMLFWLIMCWILRWLLRIFWLVMVWNCWWVFCFVWWRILSLSRWFVRFLSCKWCWWCVICCVILSWICLIMVCFVVSLRRFWRISVCLISCVVNWDKLLW